MTATDFQVIDPGAKEDFAFDWDDWLGSDSIVSSSWTIGPTGPTLSGAAILGDITSVYVQSCTFGVSYVLTNAIVTLAGRTSERSITLRCTHL